MHGQCYMCGELLIENWEQREHATGKAKIEFTIHSVGFAFFQHEMQIVQMLRHNKWDSVPKWFLGTVVEVITVAVAAETVVADQADLVIGITMMIRTVARVPLMS